MALMNKTKQGRIAQGKHLKISVIYLKHTEQCSAPCEVVRNFNCISKCLHFLNQVSHFITLK